MAPAPPSTGPLGQFDEPAARLLRRVGVAIGRRPRAWLAVSFVVCAAVSIGGWLTRWPMGGSKDLLNPMPFELQWCVAGSRTEKAIRTFHDKRGLKSPWAMKISVTMFVPKDAGATSDVATKAALAEVHDLYRQFTGLSVEVRNKTYTTFDLCARGVLPDIPPGVLPTMPFGSPPFPCLAISPLQCFSEEHAVNHPIYQSIDPIIDQIIPSAVPYSTRPSFMNSTDAEIKAALSGLLHPSKAALAPGQGRGCVGYDASLQYNADSWGADFRWGGQDGATMLEAKALKLMTFFEATAKAQARMALTKPDHAVAEDIEEATMRLSGMWDALCREQHAKNTVLEVSNFEDLQFYLNDRIEREEGKVRWGYLFGGGACMLVFCTFVLASFKYPMASRVNVGLTGLLIVQIALLTALGIFFSCGMYLNLPMVAGLSLMAMGLGVDDMFVLLRYFSNLGVEFITERDTPEVLGETLAQAGPGTTLSSLCNILTFTCAAFLPLRALSDFCVGAALIALCNYLVMVNVFVPTLAFEANRIKARAADPHPLVCFCHQRTLRAAEEEAPMEMYATSSEGFSQSVEKRFIGALRSKCAPLVTRRSVGLLSLLAAGGAVVGSIFAIQGKTLGYAPYEIFLKTSGYYRGMELIFTKFSFFPAWLQFDEVDVASNQVSMLQVFKELTEHEFGNPAMFPNYLTAATLTGTPAGTSPCDFGELKDTLEPILGPSGPMQCNASGEGWTDPVLAPVGTLPEENFTAVINAWRAQPPNPLMAWGMPGLITCDLANVNAFGYENSTGVERISYSFFEFFMNFQARDVGTSGNREALFVDAIVAANAALDRSPLRDQATVYSPILVYWEVFLDLERYMYILIGAGAGANFLTCLVLLNFDVLGSLVTTVACTMIVVEVYGIACALMPFNIFVGTLTLMGMGMAIEFTAHFATAFNKSRGDVQARLADAMASTFPALLEGSISTVLAVLPLAFFPSMFYVKYMFGMVVLVVAVGVLNGLFVLPGLLSVMGPCLGGAASVPTIPPQLPEAEKVAEQRKSATEAPGQDAGAGEAEVSPEAFYAQV